MNNYYVYIYWRLDTNEPFYVGMGHGSRWKTLNRRNNFHFTNIINKVPIAVEIIKDNLPKEQAIGIECWLINELVFEYGFSIDIPNNRSSMSNYNLCNMTWGGEGTSGMNPYENKTEEEMDIISEKKRISKLGESNPMYGKSPRDFMTEDAWNEKLKKVSGKNNYKAKCIICLTTKEIFLCMSDACTKYSINSGHLSYCCKGKRKSCGKLPNGTKLVWKYLIWNHNKRYRINSNI